MIAEVVAFINTQLETIDFVKETKGIAEIITETQGENTVTRPAIYCGKDELDKSLSDIDKTNGVVYHRLVGPVERESNEDANAKGCDIYIDQTFPMLMIAAVKKELTGMDVNSVDSKIAETLMNMITTDNAASLQNSLDLDTVRIFGTEYNTNRYEVFDEEYTGIDFFVKFEYAYVSINYSVTLSAQLSCFEKLCIT